MEKTDIVESINKIIINDKDMSGNKIINVLVKQNEYVIYEIETDDINNKIKVFIDGHTDESEHKIQNRFNTVKQKYIEAKGILTKSSNFQMMKHRIAHTLSTALNSDEIDGIKEFENLITTITKEHEELVINRTIYLLPSFIAITIFFILSYYNMDYRINNLEKWQILTGFLSSSLGGGLSILINAKTLNFEEYKTKKHYFLLGIERIVSAFIAGGIAFIAVKAGVLFPEIIIQGNWSFMFILVIAGFSETLIPRVLSKSKTNIS